MSKRVTVSTSAPATRLRTLAQRLSAKEHYQLSRRIMAGERLIIFHIDGDRVSLAKKEVAMPISGA